MWCGLVRSRIPAASLAVALACAPPKPVVVDVPASVILESGRPAGRRGPSPAPTETTFWQAMASLDPTFPVRHSVTDSERAFAVALGFIMAGETDDAELLLDSLRSSNADSLVRLASRILLTAMLQYQDKWELLAELNQVSPVPDSGLHVRDKAEVVAWAAAFRKVAQRTISFPGRTVSLPLTISASGAPMIPVSINGRRRFFWLDTGSSMSIIASDVAALSGVIPLVPDTLEVATATGRVAARPAAIARIDIGGIAIASSTAMIIDSALMRVRMGPDAGNPDHEVRIDGIIGFDVISRFDVRIDYVNSVVTFADPSRPASALRRPRNLFWIGKPIVQLVTQAGVPLHFHLDTGAQETYSTDALPRKVKVRTFKGERRLVAGFAGPQNVRGTFVDNIRLSLGGRLLVFRKLLVFAPAYSSFATLHGVFGSDIGKTGTVRIDATNGLFLIEPANSGSTLRQ